MAKPAITVKSIKHFIRKYWMILIPIVILLILFYWFILRDLPSPTQLTSPTHAQSSRIYDRNGNLLYTIYADRKQTYIPLSQIPKIMQEATIAIEDRNFYSHGALDFRGMARAFVSTVFHRQTQGGSTLTQQLVKVSLLNPQQTITRKIREALLATVTELLYPKSKILELYLNEVPYGGTVYGVEAASETYFGKPAKNLTLAEAALLAGLPESPSVYAPIIGSRPDLGKARQLQVLQDMQQQGYITAAQEKAAETEPLHFETVFDPIKAPQFVFYVQDLLNKQYGDQMVKEGGLQVKTSLDLNLQNTVQDMVKTEVEKAQNQGYGVYNGAAVVSNPATGEILAYVGSRDPFGEIIPKGCIPSDATHCKFEPGFDVARALRNPGSSMKPINYVVGLMNGYTAATPFIDQAICFPDPGHQDYCPVNYDGQFHGVQQMRYALGNSFNIPAVEMLKANGVNAMIATASAMGISTWTNTGNYGLSLTLGGGPVTMLDAATAYGVFANKGFRIDLHPILQVTDKNGKVLQSYTPPPAPIFGKQVLPSDVTFIISNILSDNGARLAEFGPNSGLYIPGQVVSAKTGTTDDKRDNWADGYTPSYVVIVWVGNNDNSPMSPYLASGITGAAPIWHDIMTYLLKDKKAEAPIQPPDVIQKAICSVSGLLPNPAAPCATRFEYFVKGTEPKMLDGIQQNVTIDKTTQDLAKSGQTDNTEQKSEVVVTDPIGNRYCLTCPHPTAVPTPTPTH